MAEFIIPDRETARRMGWRYQVQWIDDGKPCFTRTKSGHVADVLAARFRRNGCKEVVVVDLVDVLQLD